MEIYIHDNSTDVMKYAWLAQYDISTMAKFNKIVVIFNPGNANFEVFNLQCVYKCSFTYK